MQATNRACCCADIHWMSSPELLPIWKTEVEVNNKKLNRITSAGTAADSEKKMRIYSSAGIAANSLLYVRPSVWPLLEFYIFNSVNLKTVTQAEQEGKLFGRLASVRWVLCACRCACLAALAIRDFVYLSQFIKVLLSVLCVLQNVRVFFCVSWNNNYRSSNKSIKQLSFFFKKSRSWL